MKWNVGDDKALPRRLIVENVPFLETENCVFYYRLSTVWGLRPSPGVWWVRLFPESLTIQIHPDAGQRLIKWNDKENTRFYVYKWFQLSLRKVNILSTGRILTQWGIYKTKLSFFRGQTFSNSFAFYLKKCLLPCECMCLKNLATNLSDFLPTIHTLI